VPGGRHSLDAALLQPLAAPGDQTLHAGPISGALPGGDWGVGDRHVLCIPTEHVVSWVVSCEMVCVWGIIYKIL